MTYWDIRCSTRLTKVYNFNPLHSSNLFYRRLSRCSLIRNFTIGISRVNSSTLLYWWLNISMSLKHKHSQCACIMLTKCFFLSLWWFLFLFSNSIFILPLTISFALLANAMTMKNLSNSTFYKHKEDKFYAHYDHNFWANMVGRVYLLVSVGINNHSATNKFTKLRELRIVNNKTLK